MTQNGERLSERLSEQIGAVIDSGFERYVRLDASSPEEQALEERINALVDAARGRAGPRAASSRAEMEARKLGWVLDSLVENAPAMLFLKRAEDLTVELWNKQAERISGVNAADILGKTGLESFPVDQMRAFFERDRTVLDGKRLVSAEEALTGPSGETRWVYTQKIPLLDEHGEARYLLGISEDVTEQRLATEALRRAKEAAEAANQAKTDFLANVSHELRTPLTLILGPVEDALADDEAPLPPRQRDRIAMVRRNALRLLGLVNALLDLSRIEAGRAEAWFAPHDLAALTADLASTFRSAIERARLRLVVETEPPAVDVHVDREMWEKIVLNLLSNAFKFTLEGEIAGLAPGRGRRGDPRGARHGHRHPGARAAARLRPLPPRAHGRGADARGERDRPLARAGDGPPPPRHDPRRERGRPGDGDHGHDPAGDGAPPRRSGRAGRRSWRAHRLRGVLRRRGAALRARAGGGPGAARGRQAARPPNPRGRGQRRHARVHREPARPRSGT